MKKIRILITTIPFNMFFIQRYQLELPTIRLAVISKLLKQNNKGTVLTVIAFIVNCLHQLLLQNQRRKYRTGGKFSYKWIKAITKTCLCALLNKQGKALRKNTTSVNQNHSSLKTQRKTMNSDSYKKNHCNENHNKQ